MYKLSRLVENENNLHKAIDTGNPGKQLVIEAMAEIPSHLKLECTDKTSSPIILKIDDIKSGTLKDVQVFCSFTFKEPSAENCDFKVIDQNVIKIFEPKGRKAFQAIGEVIHPPEADEEEPTIIK